MNKNINIPLISREEVETLFNESNNFAIELIEKSFYEYTNNSILLPEKISQVFDNQIQNRINCLTATLLNQKICGVKWVSVFPTNVQMGLLNVTGLIILSSIETGYPIAIMDGTYITALRTAAVGATAVKYLSNLDSETIGFIGSGEQAQMHFRMIKKVRNIKKCYVSSRKVESEKKFIKVLEKEYSDVEFIATYGDAQKATSTADIIVTAISGQAPLLKADYVKKGATYIHVGGWEDEYGVAKKSDKIVCDDWESVKHRGSQTLSKMFNDNQLDDEDIYSNLDKIIANEIPGRENRDEIIYFNSVGLAFIDIMFATEVYNNIKSDRFSQKFIM